MSATFEQQAQAYLEATGVTAGWTIVRGFMPEKPARCVALTASAGRGGFGRAGADCPVLQVRVRGGVDDYDVAQTKCREIRLALHGKGVGDHAALTTVLGMDGTERGAEQLLQYDKNNRPEFVCNITAIVQRG